MGHVDPEERRKSSDRRMYDRLIVLDRLGEPPLPERLAARLAEIRTTYPEWRALPDERAHFGSWMEMRWGPDSNYSVDDLAAKDDEALLDTLRNDYNEREGLLDAWKQLATAQPQRAFTLLASLAQAQDNGSADVWEHALWGLRESENTGETGRKLLGLLADLPHDLFNKADVTRGAADLLEARSRAIATEGEPEHFWRLFDRALDAAANEPTLDQKDNNGNLAPIDWVSVAVNRSLGRIATAFMNALFARRPLVGAGIPEDLRARLDRLMAPAETNHRTARVIGASRISYLFAIDPEWAGRTLVPCFGWTNEEEAISMWQGYAWQARIDPQLWSALKPSFIPLFKPARLARLGSWGRNIAQSLMLIGVAFGIDEFRREEARDAIRAMPEEMRGQAATWIASYMTAEGSGEQQQGNEPIGGDADARWRDRIAPWLKRVWPPEPALRSSHVSAQFALAAIATEKLFPEAVETIKPLVAPTRSYEVLHLLNASKHPENHPRAVCILLDAVLLQDRMVLFEDQLRSVVTRIGAADPTLADDNVYRRWTTFVRSANPLTDHSV
ncbi:hypothetical protein [Mesorhizobium carmichaelinearum]|uniref:hypothetical protein n=1 Tax=Mesorhizobium carmichaelinearum TaxID=1208188 RepID=UPI0015CD2B7A|nr:hypothetical protein [Mesorhizobium carmichaelinearum]